MCGKACLNEVNAPGREISKAILLQILIQILHIYTDFLQIS